MERRDSDEPRRVGADSRQRMLAILPPPTGHFSDAHEASTRQVIARWLAKLTDCAFVGEWSPELAGRGRVYFVPCDTLDAASAAALGIGGEEDLFGGVVPHRFVATKAITHPLVPGARQVPPGWSESLAGTLRGAVLSGFTAFSLEDAMAAGRRLLRDGPVRVKPVEAVGGQGQAIADTPEALARILREHDRNSLADAGLVLEENLTEVTTYSIGQVRVAGLVATYYGVQKKTADERGEAHYGGSSLLVSRGGFDALLSLDLPESVRRAIAQARQYDEAVERAYPALVASRRNYDVAQGVGADGRLRSGVLEQSWRIGGASGAEVAALRAFRSDPNRTCVKVSTVESYGAASTPPRALILFAGSDPHVGPLKKYVVVEAP